MVCWQTQEDRVLHGTVDTQQYRGFLVHLLVLTARHVRMSVGSLWVYSMSCCTAPGYPTLFCNVHPGCERMPKSGIKPEPERSGRGYEPHDCKNPAGGISR